jgi:hypothetical protein
VNKANNLYSKVECGKDTYSSFSARIQESLKIYGKTIDEWWKHFGIRIEVDNLNPEICKQLLIKISNLYQEASYYYSLANSSSSALENSQASNHTEQYAKVISSFRDKEEKIPAAATIEQLVKAKQNEVYSAIATSKIVKDFFKTVLDSLNTVRKIVDTATINSGIEAKLVHNNDYRNGDE